MTSFLAENTGRVLFLHLTKDDDLVKSIIKGCKDAGIETGIVVSAIGSLSRFHYHYITEGEDIYDVIEAPLELAAMQGIILEGIPHLHGVVSTEGIKTYSGHFEEGCLIEYLAEIAIVEVKSPPIGRRKRENEKISRFEWLEE